MKRNLFFLLSLFMLMSQSALADNIIFFETVPIVGKMLIMAVAFSIPAFVIFAHIGLFEYLHMDKFPRLPRLTKSQQEMLSGTIVGLVFGVFLTILFIILS